MIFSVPLCLCGSLFSVLNQGDESSAETHQHQQHQAHRGQSIGDAIVHPIEDPVRERLRPRRLDQFPGTQLAQRQRLRPASPARNRPRRARCDERP